MQFLTLRQAHGAKLSRKHQFGDVVLTKQPTKTSSTMWTNTLLPPLPRGQTRPLQRRRILRRRRNEDDAAAGTTPPPGRLRRRDDAAAGTTLHPGRRRRCGRDDAAPGTTTTTLPPGRRRRRYRRDDAAVGTTRRREEDEAGAVASTFGTRTPRLPSRTSSGRRQAHLGVWDGVAAAIWTTATLHRRSRRSRIRDNCDDGDAPLPQPQPGQRRGHRREAATVAGTTTRPSPPQRRDCRHRRDCCTDATARNRSSQPGRHRGHRRRWVDAAASSTGTRTLQWGRGESRTALGVGRGEGPSLH